MNNYLTLKRIQQRAVAELQTAGSDSAELDVRVLLQTALDLSAASLLAYPNQPLTNAEYAKFRRMIRRRKRGEPVAYILGHKEFYGLNFIVNKNVLIPRPESEWLIERALEFIKFQVYKVHKVCNVVDVGTGSGNIIISLVKETKKYVGKLVRSDQNHERVLDCFFGATDISRKALSVAKRNATRHSVRNKIKFFQSDLLANPRLPKRFDLVIANLPYVPKALIVNRQASSGIAFEPARAIFSDDGGAAVIKKFIDQVKDRLNPGALILLELDPRNAKVIADFAKAHFPAAQIKIDKDLAGLDRYLTISPN